MNKLTSRTFWLAVYCASLAGAWGSISIIMRYEPAWMGGVMPTLIGAIILYIGGNKYVRSKGGQCGPIDKG